MITGDELDDCRAGSADIPGIGMLREKPYVLICDQVGPEGGLENEAESEIPNHSDEIEHIQVDELCGETGGNAGGNLAAGFKQTINGIDGIEDAFRMARADTNTISATDAALRHEFHRPDATRMAFAGQSRTQV